MKKKLVLILFFFGVILFSGCSLVPQSENNAQTGVKSFDLSKAIWKSTDGGKTWEAKTKGEGTANIKAIDVLSLAINPIDGSDIFVGLKKGGILESKNGGDIWKFINFQSEKVYGLAIDPRDGKTLYASGVWQGRGKIFKSSDLGGNWKEIYTSPSNGPLVISLMLDKNNPNIVYATTSDNEAIKSSNGGESWKSIYSARAPILKIALDSKNSNLLYMITNSGEIFRSSDGGGSFEDIAGKIRNSLLKDYFNFNFNVLEVDPSVGGHVYIGGENGLLESADNGETWKKIPTLSNPQTFPVKALAVNPQNFNELIYGAAQSTCQSSDGGINWSTSQFDTKSLVRDILYNSTDPSTVFLGFSQ